MTNLYSEKLDPKEQVDAEGWIAELIYNFDSYEDARAPGKEDCAQMGRDILLEILRRFRPDLIQENGAVVDVSKSDWSTADHMASIGQGWTLAWIDGKYAEIQRYDEDELERFKDDESALGFVADRAMQGDLLAQRALRIALTWERD